MLSGQKGEIWEGRVSKVEMRREKMTELINGL